MEHLPSSSNYFDTDAQPQRYAEHSSILHGDRGTRVGPRSAVAFTSQTSQLTKSLSTLHHGYTSEAASSDVDNNVDALMNSDDNHSKFGSRNSAAQETGSAGWWNGHYHGLILAGATILFACIVLGLRALRKRGAQNKNLETDAQDGNEIVDYSFPKGTEIYVKKPLLGIKDRLRLVFQQLDDLNQSQDSPEGFFTFADLMLGMEDPGIMTELKSLGVSKNDCAFEFKMLDSSGNGDGLVSREEFIEGLLGAISQNQNKAKLAR